MNCVTVNTTSFCILPFRKTFVKHRLNELLIARLQHGYYMADIFRHNIAYCLIFNIITVYKNAFTVKICCCK